MYWSALSVATYTCMFISVYSGLNLKSGFLKWRHWWSWFSSFVMQILAMITSSVSVGHAWPVKQIGDMNNLPSEKFFVHNIWEVNHAGTIGQQKFIYHQAAM